MAAPFATDAADCKETKQQMKQNLALCNSHLNFEIIARDLNDVHSDASGLEITNSLSRVLASYSLPRSSSSSTPRTRHSSQ